MIHKGNRLANQCNCRHRSVSQQFKGIWNRNRVSGIWGADCDYRWPWLLTIDQSLSDCALVWGGRVGTSSVHVIIFPSLGGEPLSENTHGVVLLVRRKNWSRGKVSPFQNISGFAQASLVMDVKTVNLECSPSILTVHVKPIILTVMRVSIHLVVIVIKYMRYLMITNDFLILEDTIEP